MSVLNTGLATPSRGYDIDQSLRFNDNDSAYLNKTWGSEPTDGNKFTFSVWVKRGALDSSTTTQFWLLGAKDSAESNIKFYEDKIEAHLTGSNYDFKTDAVFRDTSAWYHLVFTYDSDDGTVADRFKIYVNGVRQIVDDSSIPSGTANEFTKNGTGLHLGTHAWGTHHFDGHMAEVHLIDGTALTPSSFGRTGTYGEWKPIEVSGLTYGNNGFYLSFAGRIESGGGVMSATGGTITTDGDYKVHSFTADGTFTPTSVPATNSYVEYLVIAGGGAGAADGNTTPGNGGGGAGGYRTGMLTVTAQAYSITVGAGGVGTLHSNRVSGGDSVFSSITSAGGGGGGYYIDTSGGAGGSGGGGGADQGVGGVASPAGQGYAGETATSGLAAGGGGGAGEAGGTDGVGQGGDGLASSITGSSVTRAGGGGGSKGEGGVPGSIGGAGGGGNGGTGGAGGDGTANTGSGGGGGVSGGSAGDGGSGIVIIRYRFQ